MPKMKKTSEFPCRSKIKSCPLNPVNASCMKSFASVGNLRRHLRSQHAMDSDGLDKYYKAGKVVCKSKIMCQYCGLTLSNSSNLARHIESQHNSKREEICYCIYCGDGFCTRRKLNLHKRTEHSQENQSLWCIYCSAKKDQFKSVEELRLHVRLHGVSNADNSELN